MHELPPALAALGAYRQFVIYRLVPSAKPGKMDKLPCDWRDGDVKSAHNPAVWGSFQECADAVNRGRGDGIGFVFTPHDPFWFLDIDGALEDGKWSPLSAALLGRMAGAAVEVSQSGTGLHVIGSGRAPEHGCKNIPLGLEFYTELRFVALTGVHASGDVLTDCSDILPGLVADLFPPSATAAHGPDEWTAEPVPEWDGPADDDELIRRALESGARSAAKAFGGTEGVTFRDLWEANADALAKRWPETGTKGAPYDQSSADGALAAHLAFWTGKNCERIRSLMYRSALVRDKWEARGDYYLPRTILRACGLSSEVAKGASNPLPEPPNPQVVHDAGLSIRENEGSDVMGLNGQIPHFGGCTYVVNDDKVYVPSGALLNASRFDTVYGGYEFVIDPMGRKTTTSAWEAFTRNRVYRAPICDTLCFRPEYPSGAVIAEEGRRLLNTYVPIDTLRQSGDPAPFLDFLARLLPNERDRTILLSYMAAVLQNPGAKFQWWPVLQGTRGNGKTLILRVMSHGIGHRYTHLANVAKMARGGANFNAWVQGNLFVGLEEVYVANRRDFLEEFKPYVTNDRLPYEKKGVDETTGDNRCNGLALTNHRNGVPIDDDERRYAIFFTAQQTKMDLIRDGMDGSYFPDLYDWLEGRRAFAHLGPKYGYSVVNDYLRKFAVTEHFWMTLFSHAPTTSSTMDAREESRGFAEQEIKEAIEQQRPGFAGGWVSSIQVDSLLERIRAKVPRTDRRKMMNSLGFDYHPNLGPDGRVHISVMPDNGRPRLYIRPGHILSNLATPTEIAKRYQSDNMPGGSDPAEKAFGGT